jgi:hypothetical protein
MKNTFRVNAGRWLVVAGLCLAAGISSIGSVSAAGLTPDEIYWLTYIREEEKLARDVYIFLYAKWQSSIFTNISQSEQAHMDAVKTLLDRYRIPDPAKSTAQGVFTNPDLQELYDKLIEQGSASLVEALKVGVVIEETDIDDLTVAIDSTNHKDIKTVYRNLLQGSFNHLDAFCSNPEMKGVSCEP